MRLFALLSLTAVLSLTLAASATAKGGVDVDVIASGLDNPRHVAVSPWGDVYVAEVVRSAGGNRGLGAAEITPPLRRASTARRASPAPAPRAPSRAYRGTGGIGTRSAS